MWKICEIHDICTIYIFFTFISHLFHIFSHFWSPGAKNVKKMGNKCEINVKNMYIVHMSCISHICHIDFTFISHVPAYLLHIYFKISGFLDLSLLCRCDQC